MVIKMREKKNYEQVIGIKTFFNVLKRNIISIIGFTIISLCGSVLAFKVVIPSKYKTSGQFYNNYMITTEVLTTLTSAIKSDAVLTNSIEKLQEKNIIHSDGTLITKNEITNNIAIPSSNKTNYLTISYTYKEKQIICDILNVVLDETVTYLRDDLKNGAFLKLSVYKYSTDVIDITNAKQKIISFGLIGFVLAYLTSFVIDVKYDLVFDITDAKEISMHVMEMDYSERKENKKNE